MEGLIYVGSYGSGIAVFGRDGARLSWISAQETPDPSYVIADSDRPVIYAVNERDEGEVSSFAVRPDGGLHHLSSQPTGGALPCHLALFRKHLIAANYGSGNASVHPVWPNGVLGERSDLAQHEGHGPNPDRQEGPHAHEIKVNGDLVTVIDLGLDRLHHYRMDQASGKLTGAGETAAEPGSGPRHAVIHPSGRWYVTCELNSTVAIFEPDPVSGVLRLIDSVPATLSTSDTPNLPSGIALSADHKLLYVANRGADSISTFTIGEHGGLAALGEVSSGGSWPRQFTIVQDLLFVANQRADSVVAFHIDPRSGLPEPMGEVANLSGPSCVLATAG